MLIFIFPFQAQILFIWPVTTICFTVGSKFEATYITGWLCPTLVDNSQFQFVLVARFSKAYWSCEEKMNAEHSQELLRVRCSF